MLHRAYLHVMLAAAIVATGIIFIPTKAHAESVPVAIAKCVISTNPLTSIVMCLAKEGVKVASKSVFQNLMGSRAEELFDLCYNPGSLLDLVINDCKVGDPPD